MRHGPDRLCDAPLDGRRYAVRIVARRAVAVHLSAKAGHLRVPEGVAEVAALEVRILVCKAAAPHVARGPAGGAVVVEVAYTHSVVVAHDRLAGRDAEAPVVLRLAGPALAQMAVEAQRGGGAEGV